MPTLVAVDTCPVCGAPARDASATTLQIVRCNSCGLVHATAHYASEFLSAEYYAGRAAGGDANTRAQAGARKRRDLDRYNRLCDGALGHPPPGSRALDIGCNTGLLLDGLRAWGYVTEGIERSPAGAVAEAAGHRVHNVDIETQHLGLPRYRAICMTHVLEHLRHPVDGLVWLRRHLQDDGLAVIEVPNWNDLLRPLWGRHFRPLELGDHISFFEHTSLTAAFTAAGLEVVRLWSAPQAASLVVPSLLTGLDLAHHSLSQLRKRLSRSSDRRDLPGTTSGVAGPRTPGANLAGRFRRAITPTLLASLDAFDIPLERLFGQKCRWGANLVGIVTPKPHAAPAN